MTCSRLPTIRGCMTATSLMTNPPMPPVPPPSIKPPLGLIPRHIYEQATKAERIEAIKQAMARYLEAGQVVPMKWVEEYNELVTKK
jgi:hypothetical protein